MNTLILTNEPLRFHANNTTIINCDNKYTDVNGTIRQHRILGMLHGIRASKVIIYEPPIVDLRYKDWLCKLVAYQTTHDATFVYVRECKVIFKGNREEFHRFIKENTVITTHS